MKNKKKERSLQVKTRAGQTVTFTERQLKALDNAGVLERVLGAKLKARGVGTKLKNNPASTSLAGTSALQGPLQSDATLGGAFSFPGVRPQRFSAAPRPRSFMRLLKPKSSQYNDEILEIMTNVGAGSGSNAAGYCDDSPVAGDAGTCRQHFGFSDWMMKTRLNNIPQIGALRNRAEVPGQILNAGPAENPLVPDLMYRIMDTRSQLQYELWKIGKEMGRQLEYVGVRGDSTKSHTNTALGFIKEFDGLDKQIKTGHTDPSGAVCTAVDSIVINFSNSLIGGTIGGGDGRTISQAISDGIYASKDRADRTFEGGSEEIRGCFVGRREMFRALTDVYANTYATSRFQANSLTAGTPLLQDAKAVNDLRLEMLNGNFLLVEGVPIPFVYSDGVQISGLGNNQYEADLYYAPLDWEGFPLLNLEYFDLGNEYAVDWNGFIDPETEKVMNNGLYRVAYNKVNFCKEYVFANRMRLILEVPFLAVRWDNIVFSYVAQTHDDTPGSSFFDTGLGATYQPALAQ